VFYFVTLSVANKPVTLSVVMQSVIMLIVVAPLLYDHNDRFVSYGWMLQSLMFIGCCLFQRDSNLLANTIKLFGYFLYPGPILYNLLRP
jgi:hypothetical protein